VTHLFFSSIIIFSLLLQERICFMSRPFSSFPEPQPLFTDPRESDPRFKRFMEHHDRLNARRNALINLKYTLQSYGVNPKRIERAQRGIHDFLSCTDTIELPPSLSSYVPSSFYLPAPTDEEMEKRDIPGLLDPTIFPLRPTEWLWPGRLPLGALTLLEAPAGTGGSLLALTLAAHVSAGIPFPDELPCPQGRVLIISSDHISTITLPRLLAAGADLSQISLLPYVEDLDESSCADVLQRPFSLVHDLDLLSRAVRKLFPLLVIIDTKEPLTARQYQKQLPELTRLAELSGCAVLLVRTIRRPVTWATAHTLAASGTPFELLNLIRSGLRLLPASDNDSCYLVSTKHSLSLSPPDLPFQIKSHLVSSDATTSTSPGPIQVPADDLACFYAPTQPVIRWLLPLAIWPPLEGNAALPPVPASLSALRQSILALLTSSSSSLSCPEIADQIAHGYDAVRQAVSRMRRAGELVSPARGLYTTPNHPCLSATTTSADPFSRPASKTSPTSQPASSTSQPAPSSQEIPPTAESQPSQPTLAVETISNTSTTPPASASPDPVPTSPSSVSSPQQSSSDVHNLQSNSLLQSSQHDPAPSGGLSHDPSSFNPASFDVSPPNHPLPPDGEAPTSL
jgi:AAA domain